MSVFRRTVVGLSVAFLVIGIIAGTFLGALLGWKFMQFLNTSPNMSPLQLNVGSQTTELFGLIVGALAGFLGPSVAASLLYLLTEIQKNTQRTAECLRFIANGVPQTPAESHA